MESGSNAASAAATGTGTGKKSNTPEFLLKLYRILQQEDSDIISWDNGESIGHVRPPKCATTARSEMSEGPHVFS